MVFLFQDGQEGQGNHYSSLPEEPFEGQGRDGGKKKKLRSFQRVSSLDQASPRNSANVEQRECYVLFMFS